MSTAQQHTATPWRPHEAQVLATQLRGTRLTVLYTESTTVASGLLNDGVMPILYGNDVEVVLDDRRVAQRPIDFPERRQPGATPQVALPREIPIVVDHWDEPPLGTLLTRMNAALPEVPLPASDVTLVDYLHAVQLRYPAVRWLIVLHRFEEFANAPPDREDLRRFSHELVHAFAQPALSANFLLCVHEEASAALKRLRRRIAGFDDHAVRLSLRADGSYALVAREPQDADRPSRNDTGAGKHSMKTQDVYNSIEALLAKTHTAAQDSRWADSTGYESEMAPLFMQEATLAPSAQAPAPHDAASSPVSRAAPSPAAPVHAHAANPTAPSAIPTLDFPAEPYTDAPSSMLPPLLDEHPSFLGAEPDQLPSSARPARETALDWKVRASLAAAALVVIGGGGWQLREYLSEPRIGTVPTSLAPAVPRLELFTDAESSTDARVAAELAQQLAPSFDLSPTPQARTAASAMAAADGARLAIAGYDELQALHEEAQAGPLRTVMPLYMKEVQVLVRADSPLVYLSQLKGKRINVGPEQGTRALTATRVYEALFSAALPESPAMHLSLEAALPQLLQRRTLDAIVVVDAQPSPWLASLKPEIARSLKLLKLDRRAPNGQPALRGMLPASVHSESYVNGLVPQPVPTLAVRSFLMAPATGDESDAALFTQLAYNLCRRLPSLQRGGHSKWIETRPGLQDEAPWPYSTAAAAGFRTCIAETVANKP